MSCPEPIDLSRYADGDLPPEDRRAIDRHVKTCGACREAVDDDEALAVAMGRSVCPEPETLALFIDDALGAPRVDQVASHVLACEPCRVVVAWTREAAAATLQRVERAGSKSGRRRRVVRPRTGAPSWLPALVGAAAAVMVVALLLRSGRPTSPQPDRARVTEPAPRPVTPTPRTERAPAPPPTTEQPEIEGQPAPVDPAPVEPTRVDEPVEPVVTEPATPPAPPATETATPADPGATTTTPTPAPAPPPVLVAALPGSALRFRAPDGAEGELAGQAALPPGTRLLGGRHGGALRVGEATCFVDAQATLALREPTGDVARVEVIDGQVSVDAARPSIEVACGPALIRPAASGVYMVVAADGPERALLCVVSGEAELGGGAAGSPQGRLAAGESARVERDRLRPARGDARLSKAEDLATATTLAQGVDVPGGVRVRRVLADSAAALAAGDLERRAWAAYAVLSVSGGSPRLGRLAEPHVDAARRALEGLLAAPAGELGDGPHVAPIVLAAASATAPDQAAVAALAERLAARAPQALAQDLEALLALRVAERLTSFKAPRAVWAAAAALPLEGPGAGARAVLARRPLDAAARKQALADLDALLAQDPLAAALEPAALLEVGRSLALLGALDDERRARLLGHTGAPDRLDARLAVATAQDTLRLLGQSEPARAEAPASVVVVPQADGRFRVTFVFTSARRPRHVLLYGTWDQWAEPGLAMRERPDGTFTATLVLPAGRHEYKARLGVGGVWEHDARNPLTTADGMGGINSVIVLE